MAGRGEGGDYREGELLGRRRGEAYEKTVEEDRPVRIASIVGWEAWEDVVLCPLPSLHPVAAGAIQG